LPQDGKKVIGYREAMSLSSQPKKMIVVGSGAIGVEFAYFYKTMGTEVTVVEFLPNVVPVEDEEISSHGRSVCLLLGDHWFDKKNESSGYWRRDDWGLSFFPGENKKLEEITDLSRWLGRLKRERPLHDLDFCMALATIDEVKTHGRVLAPGERFADGLVGRLRRLFSHAG
jgi:hypothetical protein